MYRTYLLLSMLIGYTYMLQAQTAEPSIKVMTYNIRHGQNADGQIDINGIAHVILAVNPDIVALQEVDSLTNRVQKMDLLKELAEQTGMYIFYAKSMDYDGGGYGNGILSKFPIQHAYKISIPSENPQTIEPRSAAVALLELPNEQLVYFISTHLDHQSNASIRLNQIDVLLNYISGMNHPVILAGDFNALPRSQEIRYLSRYFDDVTSQLGPTFPALQPNIKLDYIFTHPQGSWRKLQAYVLEETRASDHRPVICDLRLK
jgi:endonuclease/exonuclease/phosphatase family metal-dependent hydrolase